MKKTLFALVLSAAALSAFATDIGVRAGRGTENGAVNAVGVTVTQPFGKVNATLAYDQVQTKNLDNRVSAVVGYDIVKVAGVTIAPKVGVGYMTKTENPVAIVGVGASYPITKAIKVGLDYQYQRAENKYSSQNGNTVYASVNYSF